MSKKSGNATPVATAKPELIAPEEAAFFEKHDRSPNGLCSVLDKFQVTPMLFHLVGSRLEDIRYNLVTGETYTPQELIGDQWWTPFNGAWRRELELCVQHFARNKHFGLRDTGSNTFEYVEY